MAVSRRRLVDWVLQVEFLDDGGRTQVEKLRNLGGNHRISFRCRETLKQRTVRACRAMGVYEYADWLCHADCVGDLDEHFICDAGSYHILGNISGCIGSAPVHLGRVFP